MHMQGLYKGLGLQSNLECIVELHCEEEQIL